MLRSIFAAPLATTIAMLKDGYFAFTPFQKTSDVLLMSEYHHQGHCNSKDAVDWIIDVKNYKDKNRESNTGQYRT